MLVASQRPRSASAFNGKTRPLQNDTPQKSVWTRSQNLAHREPHEKVCEELSTISQSLVQLVLSLAYCREIITGAGGTKACFWLAPSRESMSCGNGTGRNRMPSKETTSRMIHRGTPLDKYCSGCEQFAIPLRSRIDRGTNATHLAPVSREGP